MTLFASLSALPLVAQTPATTGVSVLQGFVMDSIHNAPLADARVVVEGTTRFGMTTAEGRYRIDSIPPGPHRVVVTHALLDTVGLQMRTPAYPFAGGQAHELDLAVPPAEKIATAICNSAQRTLGPAAMVGFVKDADSNSPAVGSKVELVYTVTDIIGRKRQTVRSALADSTGLYRICGLPGDMSGKVQVFRNGVSSGEVVADVTNGFLALRAFSIASQRQIAEVKGDSGKIVKVAQGSARVTGKVIDKTGKPLGGARVMLQGGGGRRRSAAPTVNSRSTVFPRAPGARGPQTRLRGLQNSSCRALVGPNRRAPTVGSEILFPTLAGDASRGGGRTKRCPKVGISSARTREWASSWTASRSITNRCRSAT